VVSIITRTSGSSCKLFRKYMSNIPGKEGIEELKKRAIFGMAHTCESANNLTLEIAFYMP
jgi:hypothetical protein